jgi:hypothetical protein
MNFLGHSPFRPLRNPAHSKAMAHSGRVVGNSSLCHPFVSPARYQRQRRHRVGEESVAIRPEDAHYTLYVLSTLSKQPPKRSVPIDELFIDFALEPFRGKTELTLTETDTLPVG